MMVWAIVAIGALSFVVWAHHMYVSGMNPYFGFFFATTTLIIAIPTAIKVYNWVLTLWRGDIHLTVPMLFALSFIVTFVNGGLTGLFLGNVVVDVPLSDTMFVVAHFHMVMGMAPIFVIFGAIYHWYPKITGRMLNETLGQFHFWVTFLGAYSIYFPMHYLGLLGVPRRYFELGETAFIPPSAMTLNAFITAAALIVGFRANGVPVQSDLESVQGQAGRRQPLGCHHIGMANTRNPAGARQLGQGIARGLSLGLRLQRAGRRAGFHTAKPTSMRELGNRSRECRSHIPGSDRRHGGMVAVASKIDGQAWLEVGAPDDLPGARTFSPPAATIGLGVFLAVVGSLFALLISAYLMRMHMADWSPPPAPKLLLLNTGVLIFSSIALEAAQHAAYRGQIDNARAGIVAAGISAFAFLVGQLLAWQQLAANGYSWRPIPPMPSFIFSRVCTGCICWAASRSWS